MLDRTGSVKLAAGCALFCVVAILNSGGYRYGAGDQAFYVPSVVQHLNPALFPRDRVLLHVQDRFMVFDDAAAFMVRVLRIPLPPLFFIFYLTGLVLMFTAAVAIGRALYSSWWTTIALIALLTLRHRITQTGANSLEAYFQPRMMACGVGLWAVAAYLRGRVWPALALVVLAALMHPTTGVWFGVWIGAAIIVSEQRSRKTLIGLAGAAAAAAAWAIAFGPLRGHLAKMDPRWAAAMAGKDYIFPFDWTAAFWIANFGYLAVIAGALFYRHRRGLARPRECGLAAGTFALAAVFLVCWVFMSAWVALALQLQVSRVFWMMDLLATIYVAWAVTEAAPERARRAIVALIAGIAVARGVYVLTVEHRGAPLAAIDLPHDAWTDAMQWIARSTPADAAVLADPGHAWKYGTSVRVAAERDVYLEEVKDSALALYSRDAAMRVLDRTQDAGDFGSLTTERAKALGEKYDLSYLVLDRAIDLPVAYRNPQFAVYRLK